METYIDRNMLARIISEERVNTKPREPIVLEQPGIFLRSLIAEIGKTLEALSRMLTLPTREYTFCTQYPAECRA